MWLTSPSAQHPAEKVVHTAVGIVVHIGAEAAAHIVAGIAVHIAVDTAAHTGAEAAAHIAVDTVGNEELLDPTLADLIDYPYDFYPLYKQIRRG